MIKLNLKIQVEDLMVPEELRSQYKAEAETLLSVEITKLDLQWLQVILKLLNSVFIMS